MKFLKYIVIIVLLSSCSQFIDNDDNSVISYNSKPKEITETGSIKVSVYSISPRVLAPFNGGLPLFNMSQAPKITGPHKAILIANRVDLVLKDAGDATVDSWSVYPDTAGLATSVKAVAQGNGYELQVTVFNTSVSATAPVTSGVSAPFDVNDGVVTDVSICCIPEDPVQAEISTVYQFQGKPSHFNIISMQHLEIISLGIEKWFEIEATSDLTVIEAMPDADNHAEFLVYDNQGHYIMAGLSAGLFSGQLGTIATVIFTTNPGTLYYVGLLPVTTTGNITASIDFSYYPGPPDPDEENDDFAGANPIAANTQVTGLSVDEDYYMFTVDEQTGLSIIADLDITNEGLFGLYLNIYDATQDYIEGEVLNTGFLNSISLPLTLDQTGDYYIGLIPFLTGAEYRMEWSYE